MDSPTKLSYHKQLFFILLIFLWSINLCFIGFQYFREKQYKSDSLNTQLQLYNNYLLATLENNLSFDDNTFITKQPFDNLRVSIINIDGTVVYDNKLSLDHLDNHITRPEIIGALKNGSSYHISRQSTSDGQKYFYSATRGKDIIVRTAIPYSSTLRELLRAEWTFLIIMILISLIISVIAYFITKHLGKSIERINFYEAEQEKNRLKRQLTNNINHELKTPIASIQVCLETLLSGINLSEEKKQEVAKKIDYFCMKNSCYIFGFYSSLTPWLNNLLRDKYFYKYGGNIEDYAEDIDIERNELKNEILTKNILLTTIILTKRMFIKK